MTSPLPPRLRDSRNLADLVRQQKQNARQLGNGMLGGRWSPAKLLGPAAQDGDYEDDDPLDDDQPAAWNLDHTTASVAGQVSLTLTYAPIEGTLLVFWDGIYLHPSEYVLAGQRVMFTDRHVHTGHELEAAYWYWPSDAPVIGPLGSLVLRGVTIGTGALPVETVVGDFVVIATRSASITFSDSRFPVLSTPGTEGRVYAGNATDLSALGHTGTDLVVVAAFVGSAAVDTVHFAIDPPTTPLSVPVQPGTAAIAVCTERSSFVAGSISLPNSPPWVLAATNVNPPGWGQVSVSYWCDPAATTTPTVDPVHSGGTDELEAFLLTLLGVDE